MKPKLFNGTEWIEFDTNQDHDNYINQLVSDHPIVRSVEQDIEYGKLVTLEYLRDNRTIQMTTQDSISQMQKFVGIKSLLEVGALRPAKDLLTLAEIDQIFTQERKDKYLTMLTGFLK